MFFEWFWFVALGLIRFLGFLFFFIAPWLDSQVLFAGLCTRRVRVGVQSFAAAHIVKVFGMAAADVDVCVLDRLAGVAVMTLRWAGVLFGVDVRRCVARHLCLPSSCVRVFDPVCLKEVRNDDVVTSVVQYVQFARLCVVSASRAKIVTIWNADTADCQLTFTVAYAGDNSGCVSWSRNCKRLATSSRQTVQIWSVVTGDCELTLAGHDCIISALVFSHDGKRLASASGDGSVRICNAVTGVGEQLLWVPPVVVSMSFSPDGNRLACVIYNLSVVMVWNTEAGVLEHLLPFSGASITHVCFSPIGGRFALTFPDLAVSIWCLATGVCEHVLWGHCHRVCDFCFSTDGRRFATASGDCTAKVWRVDTGACELTLTGHHCRLTSVRFATDGTRLVTACVDTEIRIWNAMTGVCELCLSGDIDGDSVAVFVNF